MKRHPSLHPLSHDHHHGLVQARRLARSVGASEEEKHNQIEAFLTFARGPLSVHFREEEEILLPALEPHLHVASDAQCQRLLQEHKQLWMQVEAVERALASGTPTDELILELANSLEKHIHFEERELFPRIENILPEEALQSLGARLRPQQGTTPTA